MGPRVMIIGVGSFAQSASRLLQANGAQAITYLSRPYAHHAPSMEGPVFDAARFPDPTPVAVREKIDFIVPMSIDWAQQPWRDGLLASGIPVLCPTGAGLRLERDRSFAAGLCERLDIPCPRAHLARNRLEAERILERFPAAYVLKNPLCSPTSPIHTIVCESVEETRAWLERLDYAEGVFLQEYAGSAEAGHFALVNGGEIVSLATNQEYKRAHTGNLGVVAGAPMGGLIEVDPEDRHGLARELIHPLRPWFQEVGFRGPVQVTAARREGRWRVLEYNVRLGVTCGAMILQALTNPAETLWNVARGVRAAPRFAPGIRFGCSVTLAGFGYPYTSLSGPRAPIAIEGELDCAVWWNEVVSREGRLWADGHRIADVVALGPTLSEAAEKAYRNVRKIRFFARHYRTDVGACLWPPGQGDAGEAER